MTRRVPEVASWEEAADVRSPITVFPSAQVCNLGPNTGQGLPGPEVLNLCDELFRVNGTASKSWGCCNRLPQTRAFNTPEIYVFTVLQAGSLN